jgi:uncharacterized SAM-binding protein YcdF (DUF218 family)
MFFEISKILGFFAQPSNLIIVIGLVGAGLSRTRLVRTGWTLVVASLLLLAVVGFLPVGNALTFALEQRFPPWDDSRGPPDGIVVLGGAISPAVSTARGAPALNEAAERLTVLADLARRFPHARIIFSGGTAALVFREGTEADIAVPLIESFGVARERITAEDRARNTIENALFSRDLAQPKPGERWLLVTSAAHMPRAVGVFRHVGFEVEPYPVDWRTSGVMDLVQPFTSLSDGLARTDTAAREWIGLIVYWLMGHTSELLPGPQHAPVTLRR